MASRPMIIQPPPPRGYNPTFPGTPAASPATTPRAYNPSSPRRVRPDTDRNAFDAMAQQAGAMSDAYNGMAQNGAIPNELRGYIDRDKWLAERDSISRALGQTSPYATSFGGTSAASLQEMAERRANGERMFDPLGLNNQLEAPLNNETPEVSYARQRKLLPKTRDYTGSVPMGGRSFKSVDYMSNPDGSTRKFW